MSIVMLPKSELSVSAALLAPSRITRAVPASERNSPTQASPRRTSSPEMRPIRAVHSGAPAMMSAALPAVVLFTLTINRIW